jgi:outer membrane murein-binding lipoprotein Lpp
MKKFFIGLILLTCTLLTGCADVSPRDNVSPRLQQDINNQQGKIDRIENNQNTIRAEIERISLINKENNNTGIQILQGDGALVVVFALISLFIVLYYFHRQAEGYRKSAEILAEQVVRAKDDNLEDNVKKAAEYTDVEERVLALLHKKKRINGS